MSSSGFDVAQADPVRNVVVPDSFRFQSVDASAELTVGHDGRELLRSERGIPEDRSILHPDQPKFTASSPTQATWSSVDQQPQQPQQPLPPPQQTHPSASPNPRPNGAAPGALGLGLEKLVGKFEGNGFNTIIRPQNGSNGQDLSDNLLELNFTHETLTFLDANVLGDVPNRGFNLQEDVNLRGIPYTQQVKDITNGATGKADLPLDDAPGIHFEQGLFMRTPALTPFVNDGKFQTKGATILPPTITRMASIPHGTTINAQCVEPTATTSGAPGFGGLDVGTIFPFPLGSTDPIQSALSHTFPQQQFDLNVTKDRIPLKLQDFKAAGTITKAEFNNPNNYLKENNDKKNIIEHVTFTVDTQSELALWGGGTSNSASIAEREVTGTGNVTTTHIARTAGESSANANAVKVTCQYWISTVEDIISIPAYKNADLHRLNSNPDLKDKPENIAWPVVSPTATAGVRKPSFKIMLHDNPQGFNAKVRYTQIQYSQNVTLDFGSLSWPHISVATLVPADPVPVISGTQLQRV